MAYILIFLFIMKRILFFVVSVFCAYQSHAQQVKSIQLRPLNNPKNFHPIVRLGEILELSFDDLEADSKEYYYQITHMTYQWEPSAMSSNQYIEGFDQNNIQQMTNSFNTLQGYTHYSVRFPNANTQITKSGNYLITILDDDYNEVFQRRCVFYEDLSTVGVAVYRSRNQLNDQDQTVQFKVNHPKIILNNPNQEIKATLIQNGNWNTAINDIPPVFIQPNQLIYNHTQLTNFKGNNEFLNFDTKYIRSTSLNIANVVRDDLYNTYLFSNEPRAKLPYRYNPDINGHYIIHTLDTKEPSTEADYSVVHFSLATPEPYSKASVYVYGGFNNFDLNEENLMTYNEEAKAYEAKLVLKQGFYNYGYALVRDGNLSLHSVDGSFFQTENEYTAIIYYRPIGGFYDRVIGVGYGFFNQNN